MLRLSPRAAALALSLPLALLVSALLVRRLKKAPSAGAAAAAPAAHEAAKSEDDASAAKSEDDALPSQSPTQPSANVASASTSSAQSSKSSSKSATRAPAGGSPCESSSSKGTSSSGGNASKKSSSSAESGAGMQAANDGEPSCKSSSSNSVDGDSSRAGLSEESMKKRREVAAEPLLRRHHSASKSQNRSAKVRVIRSALDKAGDIHIVDDAEEFELVEVLGLGTFGQAELRRVDDSDGASAASFIVIKRVPLQKLSDWSLASSVSEMTNGAKMRHPNIVQFYGAYLSKRSELCLALQYAAGGTLEDTIKFQVERGPFPVDFVTAWLSQLCDAVRYMHDNRVLHRDISTGNVFLSFVGDILLGDLGLSRQLASDSAGRTKVGTQVGTPPYMSPELVTGQDYGTSSDVWAVGVVLFEMLALCSPFAAGNFAQVGPARRAPHAPARGPRPRHPRHLCTDPQPAPAPAPSPRGARHSARRWST